MKNFMNKLQSKFQHAAVSVQSAVASKKAEGYVDSGVKILIAVVIGALLLAGLQVRTSVHSRRATDKRPEIRYFEASVYSAYNRRRNRTVQARRGQL